MIKKTFGKQTCKVEFSFPADDAIEHIYVVGDFNDWNTHQHALVKKGATYTIVVNLPANQEFEFRYLINGNQWRNDPEADRIVENPYGGFNSVISTHPLPATVGA